MAPDDTAPTPGLTLGPLDPDSSSELTRRLGVHNKADKLLKRHNANWPVALTSALGRPLDELRTETLDQGEVLDALTALKGRRAFFDEDTDVLEDAAVRGSSDRDRIVAIVARRGGETGRSFQGVIPYAGMSASQLAYERKLAEGDAPQRIAVEGGEGVDPAELEAAEARARGAEDAQRAAEGQLAEFAERLERLENPEPFEGFDQLNAKERAERVKEGGVREFGTAGLERIREYEATHGESKQVLAAVDDELATAGRNDE